MLIMVGIYTTVCSFIFVLIKSILLFNNNNSNDETARTLEVTKCMSFTKN